MVNTRVWNLCAECGYSLSRSSCAVAERLRCRVGLNISENDILHETLYVLMLIGYLTLRCHLDLWPYDLDLWPWPGTCRLWRNITLYQIWTKSNNPPGSYFTIWIYLTVTYEDNSEDLTDLTSVHCSQSVTAVGSRHSRDHKQQPTIKHSALEALRLCAI